MLATSNFTIDEKKEKLIKPSKEAFFVMGQDPDKVRGGYDVDDAFLGDVTELNLWDRVLGEKEIERMATCANFPRGNAMEWDREKFKINKALVKNLDEKGSVCEKGNQLFLFPSLVSIAEV